MIKFDFKNVALADYSAAQGIKEGYNKLSIYNLSSEFVVLIDGMNVELSKLLNSKVAPDAQDDALSTLHEKMDRVINYLVGQLAEGWYRPFVDVFLLILDFLRQCTSMKASYKSYFEEQHRNFSQRPPVNNRSKKQSLPAETLFLRDGNNRDGNNRDGNNRDGNNQVALAWESGLVKDLRERAVKKNDPYEELTCSRRCRGLFSKSV